MRLTCEVQISNRLLPTLNMKKSGKAARCQLAIGRKPSSVDKVVYLMVSTNQKSSGAMYKLYGNVQTIFTKFIGEGKANIRLKEPQVDVLISKANVNELKTFLQVVKTVIIKGTVDEADNSTLKLSCLTPVTTKELDKLKTKLVILERKRYPVTEGFPSSLEHLQISHCGLRRLDNRILNLQHLTNLDLSHNKLTELPTSLNSLSALSSLSLANNLLADLNEDIFCRRGKLCKMLRTLDLSGNSTLTRLPPSIDNLSSLHTLKADQCPIPHLPLTIGHISTLRVISLFESGLKTLPNSFQKLRLDSLNISSSHFIQSADVKVNLSFPPLVDLAAEAVASHRCAVKRGQLPEVLIQLLQSAKKCLCGNTIFTSFICYLAYRDVKDLATTTCHQSANVVSATVPVEAYLCSERCLTTLHQRQR